MGHYGSEMTDDVGRPEVRELSPSASLSATEVVLEYTVPLAPTGRRAWLRLPSDLSPDEARRLGGIIAAVAVPQRIPSSEG